MKNLVLGTLIALVASQAAGCIITTSDDTENAFITASWTIKNTNSNTAAPCPPGFDTAALYNQPVDGNLNPVGQPIIDLFDCIDGTGTSAPLPPGVFLSWIEIANTNNTSVYAQSTSAVVDITFADASFAAQILVDGGYVQLGWDLRGATTSSPLTCAQAGLAADGSDKGVQIEAFVANASTATTSDKFDCEDGGGITAGMVAGSYELLIDAFTMAGPIGSAPVVNAVVQAPNRVTNIGTVIIPINGL